MNRKRERTGRNWVQLTCLGCSNVNPVEFTCGQEMFLSLIKPSCVSCESFPCHCGSNFLYIQCKLPLHKKRNQEVLYATEYLALALWYIRPTPFAKTKSTLLVSDKKCLQSLPNATDGLLNAFKHVPTVANTALLDATAILADKNSNTSESHSEESCEVQSRFQHYWKLRVCQCISQDPKLTHSVTF